jgi:hypothetical protein
MKDRTVAERVTRQRGLRLREGWQEVRVWVPTEQDAAELRQLAERKRAEAEALHGLKEGVTGMNTATAAAILEAILSHGSKAYSTPSGPVLTLLSDLAARGDLRSFSNAFVIFARAKPGNARYVEESVPAKILNQYFCRHRGVTVTEFERWSAKNPHWAQRLKDAVRDAELFERIVEQMTAEIRAN